MTTPLHDSDARFRARLHGLPPVERMAMACRMFATGRALAVAGLLSRDRELAGVQLKRALFRHLYGREFTAAQLAKIDAALGHTRG
jgi:hypothetical protein